MPAKRILSASFALGLILLSLLAVPLQSNAQNAKTTATHLFWVRESDKTIARATVGGDELNPSLVTGVNGGALSVSGNFIYWATGTTIGRSTVTGADATTAFMTVPAFVVLATPNYLYWTGGLSASTSIGRANIDGSNPTPNFIVGVVGAEEMATDGTYLYWVESLRHTIGRSKLDGTEVNHSFIATSQEIYGMTVTGSSIYWGEYYAGAIGRANLDGTDPNESFISTGGVGTYPYGLAADGTYLYWTHDESGSIGRAALDGSGVIQAFISAGSAKGHWGLAVGRIDGAAPPPSAGPDTPGEELASTSRDATPWLITLLLLASVTAAAGIGLRVRGAKRR